MIQEIKKTTLLCLTGGLVYCWIEYFWRGWTHWSMLIIAIVLSILLDQMNRNLNSDTAIWMKAIIGGAIITVIELLAGLIFNIWLGFDVWNYSNLQWNLWGQVCVIYSVLWIFLSFIAFVLFDFLRWFLFREDKPRYTWQFKDNRLKGHKKNIRYTK